MGVEVSTPRSQSSQHRAVGHSIHARSNGARTMHPSTGPFVVTSVSWTASDAMSFEHWVLNGRRLGATGRGIGWWIGDWLRFGNARYGEKYVQAAKITGYDKQTLMNMVYVASRINVERRRERLSWSHHAEVAATEREQQEHWLDRAEESRLSVQDLRQLLRKARKDEWTADGEPAQATRARQRDHAAVCPECGHAFAVSEPAATTGTDHVES